MQIVSVYKWYPKYNIVYFYRVLRVYIWVFLVCLINK